MEYQGSFFNLAPVTNGDQVWGPGLELQRADAQEPGVMPSTVAYQTWPSHLPGLDERGLAPQYRDIFHSNPDPISTSGPSQTLGYNNNTIYPAMQTNMCAPPLQMGHGIGIDAGSSQWAGLTASFLPPSDAHPMATQLWTSSQDNPMQETPASSVHQRRHRKRQPADMVWKRHKAEIEKLYLAQNMSLGMTMKQMEEKHGFKATEKMYKDKFRQWQWSKNLPRGKATWMVQRANQRKPKDTVFEWGNQTWTIERIKKTHERVVKELETTNNDGGQRPRTPHDIVYKTPVEVLKSPPMIRRPSNQPTGSRVPSLGTVGLGKSIDDGPFHVDLKTTSIEDIREFLRLAVGADRRGSFEEAESWFLEVLSSFSRLLSPIDDETLRAGYQLASFYADHGRKNDADEVLNWMSTKHKSQLGANHERTLRHLGRVVKLLQNWSRQDKAEVFLYRILDNMRDLDRLDFNVDSLHSDQVSRSIFEEDTTIQELPPLPEHEDEITLYIKRLDKLMNIEQPIMLKLLPALIQQCDRCPDTLATQSLELKCRLAELQAKDENYQAARKTLKGSRNTLYTELNKRQDVPERLVKLGRRLAFASLEAQAHLRCDGVLETLAARLESTVGTQDDEVKDMLVIDFFTSLAAEINHRSTWERCRPWIGRALALSIRVLGPRHQSSKNLERILENERFESTAFEGVDDFMESGGRHFTLRLV